MEGGQGACEGCRLPFPEDWRPRSEWWPPLALAIIDAKDGRWPEAERRMRAWAEGNGEFGYTFLLAYFSEHTGHHRLAREALVAAARLPMHAFPYNDHEMEWLAWEATDRLYQEGDFDSALAACGRWEAYRDGSGRRGLDESYFAYRAASLLALGRFAEAEKAMAAARKADLHIRWAGDTGPLGEAVGRRDRAFRLKLEQKPTPFTWDVWYE